MMEEKFELHKKILDEMHDLYIRKNTDYGDSTHDTYLKFGTAAYLVRMYDKLNRLHSLSRRDGSAKVGDESIHDTLMSMELKMEEWGVK